MSDRYMTPELRPDGWHLLGTRGEDVGPFATIDDATNFLDWLEIGEDVEPFATIDDATNFLGWAVRDD